MKNISNRRHFFKNVTRGAVSAILTLSLFRPGNLFAKFILQDNNEKLSFHINPAYKVNVFKNGSVELYTHLTEGEKKSTSFSDLEADILLQIVYQNDPNEYDEVLGNKYSLTKEEYIDKVTGILTDLEKKGFIYYGELMLVKVKKDNGK